MTAVYSNAELETMMGDLESDLVERKRSGADGKAIRRNICAFANDLPGNGRPGVILIGVEDDGRCSKTPIDDELLKKLAQTRSDGNVQPLPSLTVQKRILKGCTVAAVMVEPSQSPPVRYRGRVWVRVGPTVVGATAADERRLVERRRSRDAPFDLQPAPGATAADLHQNYFLRSYLPLAIASDVLDRNERSPAQQLQSLRLLTAGRPTWGALLGFGRETQHWLPGAYVQFLRIDGAQVTDPIRNQRLLSGRLNDVLRQVSELLELNLSVRTDIRSAPTELRSPDYPIEALRQLAYNAIMHRSYEGTNAPVRIYWYRERVEIQNPGGLYGAVTPENVFEGVTDYRNPLVAEIMYNLGFAQRFGFGVRLAHSALLDNGNPAPLYDFQPGHVGVTVMAAT